MDQESCDAIYNVLAKYYTSVGVTIINYKEDFETLIAIKPDLVFLGMKFVLKNPDLGLYESEKIWISQYLEELNIAYTGSNQDAHEYGVSKPRAKQRVMNVGLDTSKFHVISQNQPYSIDTVELNYPLFIKPTSRGGGLGIDSNSVVSNFTELRSKVTSIALDFKSDSLIEEYLSGREFSVAILREKGSSNFSALPVELVAPLNERGARLLSNQVKSANAESAISVTESAIKTDITCLAIKVFEALGAQDYGRIDIRLDEAGSPQFLEANLMPNLISGYGSFPKACQMNLGMSYEQMILHIVDLAFSREVSRGLLRVDGNGDENILLNTSDELVSVS